MTTPLWTWEELVRACGGTPDGAPPSQVAGFSIDSRAIAAGDVFVALRDQRDGHEFVTSAFGNGAAAALVSTSYVRKPGDGPLLRVPDTLRGLEAIGRAARARLSAEARVIAVTGSAGKTGTKEMLRTCLSRLGPTHAPEKSFNNHWGVPLTLARMPADTRYGVFEIGMNHAGEITPLTRLVRPHAAIITTVAAVHLGHFNSVEEIADAKAEIMSGVEPGGVVILNRDNEHFERLAAHARRSGVRTVTFGTHAGSDIHQVRATPSDNRTALDVDCAGGRIAYAIAAPGLHLAMNSLAVLAAIEATGADFETTIFAIRGLERFTAPAGRGQRETLSAADGPVLLVDEAYNANPASIRAALETLALVPRSAYPRRIAVLGDMLELGEQSGALHVGLKEAVDAAGIDLVFAAGPHMRGLYERLDEPRRGAWSPSAEELKPHLLAVVRGGDAVVVKGSLGSRMGPLVEALRLSLRPSAG